MRGIPPASTDGEPRGHRPESREDSVAEGPPRLIVIKHIRRYFSNQSEKALIERILREEEWYAQWEAKNFCVRPTPSRLCCDAEPTLRTESPKRAFTFDDGSELACECRTQAGADAKRPKRIEVDPSSDRNAATAILNRSRARREKQEEIVVPQASLDEGGLVGLRNLGNTCFMNSVLQCLTKTKPLMDYLLDSKHLQELNPDSFTMGTLIRSFGELMQAMWTEEPYSTYAPTKLKKYVSKLAPRFAGYSQQDAQEFLVYLLEGMHSDVNRATPGNVPKLPPIRRSLSVRARANEFWRRHKMREDSAVADIFVGQLKSTVQCRVCREASTTFDPFWDLQLAIPPREDGNVSLGECMELFTQSEVLEGDESVMCSRCKKRTPASKWFSIQRFPKVLVIQLKRFYQTAAHERFKETSRVDFPLDFLDLSKYAASAATSPSKYKLYGISNHMGILTAGHYTAFCRHPIKTDEWYEFDDTRVKKLASSIGLVSSKAYLLFYEAMPLVKRLKSEHANARINPLYRDRPFISASSRDRSRPGGKSGKGPQRLFESPRPFRAEIGKLGDDATIIYHPGSDEVYSMPPSEITASRRRRAEDLRRKRLSPSSSVQPGEPVYPSVRSSPEAVASQMSNKTEDDVEEEFNSQ